MQGGWSWGIGVVCLLAGYFLGQSTGPAPVAFPDPAEARTAAEMEAAVDAALVEPRAFVRVGTLTRLFEGLSHENVDGAAAAITGRAGRWDPIDLQLFLAAWVQLDPESAVRNVEAWPIKSRRRIGLNVAVREWAASGEVIAAANYVQGIANADRRRTVSGPLVRGWALSGDFQGALNLAHRLYYGDDAKDVTEGFVRGVLQVGGPAPVLKIAGQVAAQGDGPFEQRLVRVALNLAAREDAAAAAKVLSGITAGEPPPEWLQGHIDLLAGLWRNEDDRAALEWVLSEAPSEERQIALMETIGTWANRDYDGAWAWFEAQRGPFSIDDEDVLDETDSFLLSGLVQRLARRAPAEASRWVVRIRPGEVRNKLLNRVVRFWARTEGAAAAAWVEDLVIDPSTREELETIMRKLAEA